MRRPPHDLGPRTAGARAVVLAALATAGCAFTPRGDATAVVDGAPVDAAALADATVDATPTVCPSTYLDSFGGSRYRLGAQAAMKTWDEAAVDCTLDGQRLAVIESAAENEFVRAQLQAANPVNDWSWIGLRKSGVDGVYLWVTGAIVLPTDYQPFSPMIGAGNDCFNLNDYSGLWGDYACGQVKRWVCECDLTP